jgi:predicted SAM-dependent methyltransferase
VLAIRDRPAQVLERTLSTYAYQSVQPADKVLLDYGSSPPFVQAYRQSCERFGWRLVSHAPVSPGWHLSAAYNAAVAALGPNVDVVFKGEVDVLLGRDVLETALSRARDKLCIFSCLAAVQQTAFPPAIREHAELEGLLRGQLRPQQMDTEGFHAYPRRWFEEIGGFDLAFCGGGFEDSDLRERAKMSIGVVYVTNCLLVHQWHPVSHRPEDAERNRAYYKQMSAQRVLVRNGAKSSAISPAAAKVLPVAAARAPSAGLKLNLGCGEFLRPGWLNVDCRRLHPDGPEFLCCDLLGLDGRVEDGSVERILARDVLDCIPWREVEALLAVLVRKLRPGGSLSLRVRDGERIARLFAAGKLSHHQAQRLLLGDQARAEDTRRSLWSADEARRRLEMVGLKVEHLEHRRLWLIVRGKRLS